MPISFEKVEKVAEVLDPSASFQRTTQAIEHRKDPLTGDQSIVLKGRLNYVRRFFETDERFLFQCADETKGSCPFCPLSVETSTPRFPPEIVEEGRIKAGEAVMFPSLFAHVEYNAVTVLTRRHLLQLDEFTPELLRNGLTTSLTYLRNVHAKDENVRYAAATLNYLPPAGSTVIHPTMQTLASSIPFRKVRDLLDSSRVYFERWRANYWNDIIEAEKKRGERYLGRVGSSEWLLPFSPHGFYEVDAVLPGKVSFLDFTEDDLSNLAEGLSRVLAFYKKSGIWSFNVALFSGPLGFRLNHFAVNARVVARYGFRQRWVNDMWALPYLLQEPEVFDAPEALKTGLSEYFE